MELARRLLEGQRLALARGLTLVENGAPAAEPLLAALAPHTGRAHVIGVTGAPGAGKSTLVTALARAIRADEQTVAILAVDPSSPFSGGAILGDRVRMNDLAGDPGVFIRSIAARGAAGGLAQTTAQLVDVLDAYGFQRVIVETVGAGQSEVEIVKLAATMVVVDAPGLGDEIQAVKAGILEIADILVVNKADLPGADAAFHTLRTMLPLANGVQTGGTTWTIPLLKTVATNAAGVDALVDAIDAHRDHVHRRGSAERKRRERLVAELEAALKARLFAQFLGGGGSSRFEAALEAVVARRLSPEAAAAQLLAEDEAAPTAAKEEGS